MDSLHQSSQNLRALIMGNGGSGKTWLARELGLLLDRTPAHLDNIHWEPGGCGVARDRQQVIADVESVVGLDRWLIEGVYGRYIDIALTRATLVVWLDLPEEACIANIRERGPQYSESEAALEELIVWVADYRVRQNNWNSYERHLAMFERYAGPKFRLLDRNDVGSWLANFADGLRRAGPKSANEAILS
ncbi:AAA family ATPase [Neorhizobium sp. JUb45]|uniref:AAA family ATPase n=1 Tax=unclassified Neorhizobium TaxID=2629175 RepID=UPI0010EE98F0|nr:AAA family ATPase [Neorhizobium sp. JUb45]TCR06474.1 adenylate kinase family enzyme [Neorhizobium sp. JUb45]